MRYSIVVSTNEWHESRRYGYGLQVEAKYHGIQGITNIDPSVIIVIRASSKLMVADVVVVVVVVVNKDDNQGNRLSSVSLVDATGMGEEELRSWPELVRAALDRGYLERVILMDKVG